MEEPPVAAAQAREASSTNSNPADGQAPAAPATPATSASAPATPTANIPADQIEAFNRFVESNGGFEKAFAKLRTDVSTPATAPAQAAPAEQNTITPQAMAQQAQQAQVLQSQPVKVPDGFITPEEVLMSQYYGMLADKPEYAPIADKIRSGEIFNEMRKFNIQPMQNGAINNKQVHDFLDLYVKTAPAATPSAPVSSTPTADYVQVGDKISSADDAYKILLQNMQLRGSGMAEHPMTQAAKDFIAAMHKK